MIVSKEVLSSYTWGNACQGWHLVNQPELSIIQERMPPHTREVKHFHHKAQQFFFILQGEATFQIESNQFIVKTQEGIHIQPGQPHQILNQSTETLEFLVISQPHAHQDRTIAE